MKRVSDDRSYHLCHRGKLAGPTSVWNDKLLIGDHFCKEFKGSRIIAFAAKTKFLDKNISVMTFTGGSYHVA